MKRKELKKKAKGNLKKHYWLLVIVVIIYCYWNTYIYYVFYI